MSTVDLLLKQNAEGIYDIDFGSDGDFLKTSGFDTAILMSLFMEKRASEAEVLLPQFRRGWWGNELNEVDGYEIGSKLWLLDQVPLTESTVSKAVNFAQDSLSWLKEDGLLKDVTVTGTKDSEDRQITLNINLVRLNGSTEDKFFELWDNTGTI